MFTKIVLLLATLTVGWYLPSVVVPVLVAATLLLVATYFGAPLLAEEGILFTNVEDGQAKAVMHGKTFAFIIMAFAGYHLNDSRKKWYEQEVPQWEVLPNTEEDNYYDDRPWLLKHLGLYWVGWPWTNKVVYVYKFEWVEIVVDKDGKEQIRRRHEATDFVYVKDFVYVMITDRAETSDALQTDEQTMLTTAINNPYKALFRVEDWMQRTTVAANPVVKDFVSRKGYVELIHVTKDEATDLSTEITALTSTLPGEKMAEQYKTGLSGRYGVTIKAADLQKVDLSGDQQKKNDEAAAMVFAAEQGKRARILGAEGEARATQLDADARAYAINKVADATAEALEKRLGVIDKHEGTGIALAGYDGIVESSKGPGKTVIWGNNPLSAIGEVFKSGNGQK